jgi:hypothetical protein
MDDLMRALKAVKNWKAPGVDQICAELLKAGSKMMTQCLIAKCNQAWHEEVIPEDWKRGVIVCIPKKGDLTSCDNWRGVILLSVPEKVYSHMILYRTKSSVDQKLREKQAGFRQRRSCVDQIYMLRWVLEDALEYRKPAAINFVDFEKAFDSLD